MVSSKDRGWQRAGLPGKFLLVWVLISLACNLPTAPGATPASFESVEQTLQSARETLASQSPATQTAVFLSTPQPDDLPTAPGSTPEPVQIPSPQWNTPTSAAGDFVYITQPGDTPEGLAGRFGLPVEQIANVASVDAKALMLPGQQIVIPNRLGDLPYRGIYLPDSEVILSPAAQEFSTVDYVNRAGGFLSSFQETIDGKSYTGAQIIERVAYETSINPRLLLAVLEYRSHWVLGQPADPGQTAYPIGFYASSMQGLHKEITLAARQLTIGYYGWRSGQVTELEFANGKRVRLDPTLNAGTVAVQTLFSKLVGPDSMADTLYGENNFIQQYQSWHGDPWLRAQAVGPVIPFGLQQPVIELPFAKGTRISFTGGPHAAWGIGSPMGGIDFAPADVEKGCTVSRYWVTAGAPGIVVRSEFGQVILDLDMDGKEQTGWVLLYLHIAENGRVQAGTRVEVDDPIGHPSCEGGIATGTHVHMARKFNGEWMAVDGPVPFVISGWQVFPGSKPYHGTLIKGDNVVTSRLDQSSTSVFTRE